jgi:DNA-directed RNA polymerase subunit RPC12/RpoP
MGLVTAKCPECGAKLKIDPEKTENTCEYCGAVSRVEKKGKGQAPAPPPPAGQPVMPVIRVSTGSRLMWLPFVLVPLIIALTGGGISFLTMFAGGGNTPGGGSSIGQSFGEKMQWISSKQPMLADLTGDGVSDVIGWVRFLGMGGGDSTDHLAAFDAVSGARLWKSQQITNSSQSHETRVALAGDKLLVADPVGMLKALSVYNGQLVWSAQLGERVERFCGLGAGAVRVEKKDKQAVSVTLATGQLAPAGAVSDTAPCTGLWTDTAGQMPTVTLGGGTFDNVILQPEIEGMNVAAVVVDQATGSHVAIGGRKPGTEVPSAALYKPSRRGSGKSSSWMNKPKEKPVWVAAVPAVNPMTVSPGAIETATISFGRLVAPYQMQGSNAGWRLACLDVKTGRNLWDVAIPLSDVSNIDSVVASDRQVFVPIWTYLHVFDLGTGQHRMTIGKW